MLSDVTLLMKTYWRIDQRGDSRQSRLVRILSYSVLVIVGVLFSAAIGAGAGELITNPNLPLQIRLGTLPGVLLSLVLVGTVFVGINQAIRALYLTNDMELLFSAPIRTEAVMTAKLVSRLPGTILITLILTIPALIAFGITTGLGLPFYFAGTIALLLAPLFGLSAGALLAMLIVRVLPAQRVSEYLGAASIMLGVIMAMAFQLPRLLRDGDSIDPQAAEALTSVVASLESVPLPSMWAGQGLVDLAQGRFLSAVSSLSLYLLMTAGFFALTVLLANKLYLNGWLRMQGSGITRSGYSEQAGIFGSGSVAAGIATKDWLMRLRDARQLAGLVSGLVFAVFFSFIMLRPGSDQSLLAVGDANPETFIDALFSPGIMISGIILYAGWITFNRAAITSLSIEANSIYILKSAPIDPRTVFRSKVLGLVLPFAVGSMFLLVLAWFFLRFSPAWIPYAWICLAIIGYGMITISTMMGFKYPRLDWDDPRRMTSGKAVLPNLLLNAIYGLLSLIIATLPFLGAYLYPGWTLMFVLLGLLILASMAWIVERVSARQVTGAWAAIELPG